MNIEFWVGGAAGALLDQEHVAQPTTAGFEKAKREVARVEHSLGGLVARQGAGGNAPESRSDGEALSQSRAKEVV